MGALSEDHSGGGVTRAAVGPPDVRLAGGPVLPGPGGEAKPQLGVRHPPVRVRPGIHLPKCGGGA